MLRSFLKYLNLSKQIIKIMYHLLSFWMDVSWPKSYSYLASEDPLNVQYIPRIPRAKDSLQQALQSLLKARSTVVLTDTAGTGIPKGEDDEYSYALMLWCCTRPLLLGQRARNVDLFHLILIYHDVASLDHTYKDLGEHPNQPKDDPTPFVPKDRFQHLHRGSRLLIRIRSISKPVNPVPLLRTTCFFKVIAKLFLSPSPSQLSLKSPSSPVYTYIQGVPNLPFSSLRINPSTNQKLSLIASTTSSTPSKEVSQ